MTRKQNIIDNTPASGWRLATKKEKRLLSKSLTQPYYVTKQAKVVRKGSPVLTRDAFTVKKFGMHRRKLAEVRATPEGAAHPVHGYKRPVTGRLAELLMRRRETARKRHEVEAQLKLVRKARAAFERHGAGIAARARSAAHVMFPFGLGKGAARGRMLREDVKAEFGDLIDKAIGPDTGEPVESREIVATREGPEGKNIAEGVWHQLIDAVRDAEGDNSPLVKLLRSSGRYVEGGQWVVD